MGLSNRDGNSRPRCHDFLPLLWPYRGKQTQRLCGCISRYKGLFHSSLVHFAMFCSKVAVDWEIRIWDCAIEREIRNRISLSRNPSLGWISIKESKSGFHRFPSLPYDREIRKRVFKTILLNSGLLFANYACACRTAVLKNSFSNPFSDFPKKTERKEIQAQISEH